ncbi:MAG: hypothetical protein EAZ69_08880 [Oscillatoriales cyanobacterium]|nr:MAG: hypothetical protein EAZ69_08880 [Oscillatoriales cyanobacterium]
MNVSIDELHGRMRERGGEGERGEGRGGRGGEGERERGRGGRGGKSSLFLVSCYFFPSSLLPAAFFLLPTSIRYIRYIRYRTSSFFRHPSDFHPLHPLQNPLPNFLLLS